MVITFSLTVHPITWQHTAPARTAPRALGEKVVDREIALHYRAATNGTAESEVVCPKG
jgi:hypothetical protein